MYDMQITSYDANLSFYLMKREFVSQGGQMELFISANVSSMRVTGVVLATTPPMPKLEQKSTL